MFHKKFWKYFIVRRIGILKYIFILFNCCMIFSVQNFKNVSKKKAICTSILFTIEIFISLVSIFIGIWQINLLREQPRSIANSLMNFVTAVFRIVLSWKMKSLEIISNELRISQCISSRQKKSKTYFYLLWIIYVVVSAILNVILNMFANIEYKSAFSNLFFRSHGGKTYFYTSISAYSVSQCLFNIMPMHIFPIYYSLICCQIKHALNNFLKILKKVCNVDYAMLYKQTMDLENVFYLANSNLDFLVFIIVLLNGANMYHAITLILYPQTYESSFHRALFYLICSTTFMCFFLMMAAAVKVNDCSAEISREVKKLPINYNRNVTPQLRFYFCMHEREMEMKIWGVGSIKRNFILAVSGTIFTYCILVDGIWISRK